jgi:prevent-host-death family protein
VKAFMREIKASEAKTRLSSLLAEVERGETLGITRRGKRIARIVPEAKIRREQVVRALANLEAFRKTMPPMSVQEILSARHEGH